jgi:hypothetical protein
MGNDLVDVTIHIDEALDHARLQTVAERLRQAPGIASAVFHDTKPHFLLVRYTPAEIDALGVHRLVTQQGVHAELIGL